MTARAESSSSVDIPTSTVVSIGLGFVAFAISILVALMLTRMLRVFRRSRDPVRNTRNETFRQMWRNEGGFWGFLTGLGGESAGLGAGGIGGDIARMRRWAEFLRLMELEFGTRDQAKPLGKTPEMWEVGILPKNGRVKEELPEGVEREMFAKPIDEDDLKEYNVGFAAGCPIRR